MNRKIVLLVLVVGLGCWFGVRSFQQSPPKPPGDLTKAEIESEVGKALKLKEVHLTETARGKFSGTGSASDGTNCKIKVTQSQNKVTWESEDQKGGIVIGSKQWNGQPT
jgi:hypothetical protein